MSSRALRRLQKQQEQEQALARAQEAAAQVPEEDEEAEPPQSKKSAFAFLDQEQEDDDDNDEDEEHEAVIFETPKPISKSEQPSPAAAKLSKGKKKKKNKARGPATPPKAQNGSDNDQDIDALLDSLANQHIHNTGLHTQSEDDDYYRFLSVDTQHLHVINEMRRLFGREAINERPRQPAQQAQDRNRRIPPQQQEQGRGFPTLSLRRNIFVQSKETWPRAATGGLSMDVVSKDSATGETFYRIVHSTGYQETQRQYEIAVRSMDPQRLVFMLQQYPYHIATLLQVSEIMRHDRTYTEAGDMLERALFTFGRIVHSSFAAAMAAGKARLDFRYWENREFYLAVWRYILDLRMRGTWRTAYEWVKLLLALSPEDDPYALHSLVGQFALRSNKGGEFFNFLNTPRRSQRPRLAPNEFDPFTAVLCMINDNMEGKDMKETAVQCLDRAIRREPHLVYILCSSIGVEPMPPALEGYSEPPTPRIKLLGGVYLDQLKDLWSAPEAKDLLETVARRIDKDAKLVPDKDASFHDVIPTSLARQIYLLESDFLLRLLAPCIVVGESSSVGDRPTQDPFPPQDTYQTYDPRPVGDNAQGIGIGAGEAGGEGDLYTAAQEFRTAWTRIPIGQRVMLVQSMSPEQIREIEGMLGHGLDVPPATTHNEDGEQAPQAHNRPAPNPEAANVDDGPDTSIFEDGRWARMTSRERVALFHGSEVDHWRALWAAMPEREREALLRAMTAGERAANQRRVGGA